MKKINILTHISHHNNFPVKAFETLYKAEEKHFWFIGRNEVINIIINRFIKQNKKIHFLEIGCGNGNVLRLLKKFGFSLTGLDIHLEGLRLARKRTNAKLICADIYKLHTNQKYDVVGLFDVIEHLKDDAVFLQKSGKMLKKGGKIIIRFASLEDLNKIAKSIID